MVYLYYIPPVRSRSQRKRKGVDPYFGFTPLACLQKQAFLYIKNFNASVGEGGYLPQSDRDDEDTLKTAAVFNRAEK